MQPINVLSLFDGCSGGNQALEMSGIKVSNYYACEIDKYAIQVTQSNYPNTIQLGDVTKVDFSKLPKIDLLIGGSPCQSFSFAGKRNGMSTKDSIEILTLDHYLELKKESYEFEGQSYLFWEYMNAMTILKPKYFLLENVEMGEKWEKVLSKAIGVNGIHINSALLTAQNRKRIYWTNIGMVTSGLFGHLESIIQQPKDKKIVLKDILENEVDEKYFLSEKMISTINKHGAINHVKNQKSNCILSSYFKMGGRDQQYIIHNMMPRSSKTGKGRTGHLSRNDGKTYCLDTGNTNALGIKCVAMRGRGNDNLQQLEERKDDKTNCLTSVQKDNLIMSGDYRSDEGIRRRADNKTPTLMARARNDIYGPPIINTSRIRRLTPLDCERLQGMKDNYTNFVSDSQRYKMIGNGWTIPVISHLFNYIK